MDYAKSLARYSPAVNAGLAAVPKVPLGNALSPRIAPNSMSDYGSFAAQQAPAAGYGGLTGANVEGVDLAGAAPGGWWSDLTQSVKDSGFLGSTAPDGTKTQGWGGMALGAAQGLANSYMGMQQYGLAKDTFNENKRQFALNFGNQQKLTNSRLEDRQAARVASNANAYQSVGEYMKKNGV